MKDVALAPFGTWPSPIAASDLLAGALGLANPRRHEGALYWQEARPSEAGRTVIVRMRGGEAPVDCTPAPFNARTRVHEYGGICYTVHAGSLYFSNFADQRIWRIALPDDGPAPSEAAEPLTADDGTRYADFVVDAPRNRLVVVAERDRTDAEPRNFIAAIDLADGTLTELASGSDFYSSPRLSPDGEELVWLQWDHPRMPWDGTELVRTRLDAHGVPTAGVTVAGGATEAVFQPGWMHDGRLVFVSDRSGFWNLCAQDGDGVRTLHDRPADFGLPMWVFGMRTWAPLADGRIACLRQDPDRERLGILDPDSGVLVDVETAWTSFDGIEVTDDGIATIVSAPDAFPALVLHEPGGGEAVLRRASTLELDEADISVPEAITFPSDGAEAHAFLYAPRNAAVRGPEDALPPLVVIGHGGPTAATAPVLNLKIQFWTSRGFAVLDVNYRGSTGYGRAYRDALKGCWGIADVEDCVAAARFVADRGDVDAARMAIRGGSAGGLTVLNALIDHDVFRAGASLYGVADLAALAADTHKFESRYLDSLVGPWPEAADVYAARSPVGRAAGLTCPVIFLQGLEDRIVPPSQPEAMIAVMKERRVPYAYVTFEGEQHGFRQGANIRRALEAELYFYGRVFGFSPADDIEPVEIVGFD